VEMHFDDDDEEEEEGRTWTIHNSKTLIWKN
jgi:hypothetical protein